MISSKIIEDDKIKEAEEEIGLKDIKPQIGPKERISGKYNYFDQWYTLKIDKLAEDFVIDKSEVEQVKWFPREELLREIQANPDKFLKNMKRRVEIFCK